MKWAVHTKIYDSGRVAITGPYAVPDDFKSVSVSHPRFDSYTDVFETYEEADKFITEECA